MPRSLVWFVYVYLLARAAALAILHHRIDARLYVLGEEISTLFLSRLGGSTRFES